jgi:hypothetical protein
MKMGWRVPPLVPLSCDTYEPLTAAYLAECEQRARRFSGAYTGTSGTLAADVMRLLAEVRRLRVEAARHAEATVPYWMAAHD